MGSWGVPQAVQGPGDTELPALLVLLSHKRTPLNDKKKQSINKTYFANFNIITIPGFYSFHRLRGLTPSKMEAFAPQNFHKTNKKFVSAKSGGADPPYGAK